jgi:hypothetical protein
VAVDGPTDERDAPDEQPVREVPQAHDAPHDPDQPELLKAVGELAAENADLYRKIGELTHALKTQQGRFGTWAREVARDREQAAQDKAQMAERLDKVLAMNEALAHRVADLEQERADQSPVTSAGAPERRIGAEEGVARQTDRKHLRRLKVSNEVISVGTMGVSTAATVMADVLGSAAAGDTAGIAGNALGLAAAVIALTRKSREDKKDGHRTQG